MNLNKAVLTILLLTSSHVFAGPATKYEPSDADLKRIKINLCELSAEKARSITRATIKAKKFNADSEVIAQTAAESQEREIMQQLFQSEGLISTVLIQGASFGASMMPSSEGVSTKQNIEELTFLYVRSLCISASLEH
jgi:hypothetical protein